MLLVTSSVSTESDIVMNRDLHKIRIHCLECTLVYLGNGEVVAGTGEQCPPFDEARCGDGRKATEAQLLGPKGTGHTHNSQRSDMKYFYQIKATS